MKVPLYEKLLKIQSLKPNDNTILIILNNYPNLTSQEERHILDTYNCEYARYQRHKNSRPFSYDPW